MLAHLLTKQKTPIGVSFLTMMVHIYSDSYCRHWRTWELSGQVKQEDTDTE